MLPFRFRAETALTLRRRQEDEAEVALARAEAQFSEAHRAVTTVVERQAAAAGACDAAVRGGTTGPTLDWHRNWMTGLAAALEVRRREMNRHEVAVAGARKAWYAARRKRLMLERLRDRAQARYRVAEQRWESKQL